MQNNIEHKLSRNTIIELLKFIGYSEDEAYTMFYNAKENNEISQLVECIMVKIGMAYLPVCIQ